MKINEASVQANNNEISLDGSDIPSRKKKRVFLAALSPKIVHPPIVLKRNILLILLISHQHDYFLN